MTGKYRLVESESADWYIVPAEKYEEAHRILRPWNFQDEYSEEEYEKILDDYQMCDIPDWFVYLGNPEYFEFENPVKD